jgi:sarcosine oxidase subunit beta
VKATDVVVIGAGIIGSSTAYYLAQKGVDVTLIDAGGPLSSGTATQACAGGVRQQGRVPSEIPLALYAIKLWTGLEDELDADLQYRQGGMTVMVADETLIPRLQERVALEQSLGLDIRLIQKQELHDLIPGLSNHMLAGSYCPSDGHADPMRTISAFTVAAGRLGAHMHWYCPAESLVVEKHKITAVKTAKGKIACRQVVLAAGMWSKAIAATAGLDLPFQPFTLQMMVTAPRPPLLDQVLGWLGHGISLKQVPAGGFVIGGGWPGHGDPHTYQTRLYPGSMAKSAKTAVDLFPSLAGVPVVRAWVGIEAFSTDEMQIIGPVADIDGLILAAGFSGHGFGIGPGVGALIAGYLGNDQLPDLLRPYSIERFKPDVL